MSFLSNRRRSLGPMQLLHAHEAPLPPIPFPPAIENISVSQPSTLASAVNGSKKSGPGRIIRRVSNIFSGRKKRQPAVIPLDVLAPPESRWRVTNEEASPTESEVSFDDIRRPSGLGRAASISSKRSLPPSPFTAIDEESPFHMATSGGYERVRALSSPNPLRSVGTKNKTKPLTRSSSAARRNPDRPLFTPQLPREVLSVVLSFLSRYIVASLATTSRDFCAVAKTLLYKTLDLRTLRPNQVESLVTLLAYRHDLTELVRTFECYTWPAFFPPQSNLNGVYTHHSSFSPALTATFTIAFQNMHRITTLVLPSFDTTFLRHHSAFGLEKITILSHTMAATETTQLFAWLNGQTNITYLAFPNLVDAVDTPATSLLIDIPKGTLYPNNTLTDSLNTNGVLTPSITPTDSPTSPFVFLPPAALKSPFNSPALLPALTTLVATPFIVTSLITNGPMAFPRPLQNVILTINSTLYTGLRPAALLNTLHGITTLVLRFGSTVDKRTIGKVLSAGAALSPTTKSKDAASEKMLQILEVVLSDSAAGVDQALYKIIASALPRYRGLVELRTRFAANTTQEMIAPPEPALSDREDEHVRMWAKHCPSLKAVQLLSGARWNRLE